MNTKRTLTLLCLAAAALTVILAPGCAQLDKALTKSTEVVTVDPVTGASVTNIVLKVRPEIEGGAKILTALPFPFAGVAGTLVGFAASAYLALRQRKVAVALVQGIEAGRELLQNTPEGQKLDTKLKDELIKHQEAAGVVNAVAKLVNRYTGDTVKPTAQRLKAEL